MTLQHGCLWVCDHVLVKTSTYLDTTDVLKLKPACWHSALFCCNDWAQLTADFARLHPLSCAVLMQPLCLIY